LSNEDSFTNMAKAIKLQESIFLSKAEEKNKGREKPSILSNAFEAVIGALYLDSGMDEAKRVINLLLEKLYPTINMKALFKDYKTLLQEITQAKFNVIPEYIIKQEKGPDHDKEFEIVLKIDGKNYASAIGKAKNKPNNLPQKKLLNNYCKYGQKSIF